MRLKIFSNHKPGKQRCRHKHTLDPKFVNDNELQKLLNQATNIIGLKINPNKTKILSKEYVQLSLEGHPIISENVYLDQTIKLGKENHK